MKQAARSQDKATLISDFLLIGFENVVEVRTDREWLAVGCQGFRCNVRKKLVPGSLIEFAFKVLGIDAWIPVEALDDAFLLGWSRAQ
jgi:hypothetical protein